MSSNIARHLPATAARLPGHPGLLVPRGRTAGGDIDYLSLSFSELDREVDGWSARLRGEGIGRGDRVLVLVRPGLPLVALAFALFKLGAVPVLIDPGMGLRSFLACVRLTRPGALVGVPAAQRLARIFRRSFRSVGPRVPVPASLTARVEPAAAAAPVEAGADELAAVLFTSGSTGRPKGVRYLHRHFEAQLASVGNTYGIEPGEVDMTLLPIFALFNPALGMTSVVPEVDPRRPARLDPACVVQAIRQCGVTNSFGAPTLWRRISDHCIQEGRTLPSLRRVLVAGAPVPAALAERLRAILPRGEVHTPYGATEALPVCTWDGASIVADTGALAVRGRGTCVGRPVAGMQVAILRTPEGPLPEFGPGEVLPAGEIGEIAAHGPVVTESYDHLAEATALAKCRGALRAGDTPGLWHRMGDLGYLDAQGRLWFVGRKAERVETARGTLHTEQVEPVFNQHPKAARTALIGLGQRPSQEAALAVQPAPGCWPRGRRARAQLAREILSLGSGTPLEGRLTRVFFLRDFPVDVRHNAKIHRLTLARRCSRPWRRWWSVTVKP